MKQVISSTDKCTRRKLCTVSSRTQNYIYIYTINFIFIHRRWTKIQIIDFYFNNSLLKLYKKTYNRKY